MKQNTLRLVWFALIFLLVAWLNLSLFGYAEDDAYIHFRIAENFLLHGAPYYNPGEKEVKPDITVSYDVLDEALVYTDAPDDYVTLREQIFTREDMHLPGSREIWGSRGLNIHIRRDLYEESG